jgi:hypothetical protein
LPLCVSLRCSPSSAQTEYFDAYPLAYAICLVVNEDLKIDTRKQPLKGYFSLRNDKIILNFSLDQKAAQHGQTGSAEHLLLKIH